MWHLSVPSSTLASSWRKASNVASSSSVSVNRCISASSRKVKFPSLIPISFRFSIILNSFPEPVQYGFAFLPIDGVAFGVLYRYIYYWAG